MSVWVTSWMWMRVSSDCCIVVLSECSVLILLEWQHAREEIIITPQPEFTFTKTCFKEKSRDLFLILFTFHAAISGFFNVLQLSLDLYYTEDEIYELSYAREPKNCKAPVSDSNRHDLSKHLFTSWKNSAYQQTNRLSWEAGLFTLFL